MRDEAPMAVTMSCRKYLLGWAFALLLVAHPAVGGSTEQRSAVVVPAQLSDGRPLPLWIDALKRRMSEQAWRGIAVTAKPLRDVEKAWLSLIEETAPQWMQMLPQLDAAFPAVDPPEKIVILAGNQGGNDGFTHRLDIICTDLSDLVRNYGEAAGEENRKRMLRILSHEYTHLLTKAWLEKHPWPQDTPFLQAVGEMYYEGLGHLYSLTLSSKWITPDHRLTDRARAVLEDLEPRMLERLQGLARDPAPEAALHLHRSLSAGPFAEKWGALPVALWLAVDTGYDPPRIAQWVERGPVGILELVVKHAAPQNRPGFQALLDQVGAESARPHPQPSASDAGF